MIKATNSRRKGQKASKEIAEVEQLREQLKKKCMSRDLVIPATNLRKKASKEVAKVEQPKESDREK